MMLLDFITPSDSLSLLFWSRMRCLTLVRVLPAVYDHQLSLCVEKQCVAPIALYC